MMYVVDPRECVHCGVTFTPKPNRHLSRAEQVRLCSNACVTRHHWSQKPSVEVFCHKCGDSIGCVPRSERYQRSSRYCAACDQLVQARLSKATSGRTKAELFAARKNWQSARSAIVHHAAKRFAASGRDKSCHVCGYTTHIEVAHIRPVSAFPDEAMVGEINDLSNLVALCPNHHWEFDNGLISIGDQLTNLFFVL